MFPNQIIVQPRPVLWGFHFFCHLLEDFSPFKDPRAFAHSSCIKTCLDVFRSIPSLIYSRCLLGLHLFSCIDPFMRESRLDSLQSEKRMITIYPKHSIRLCTIIDAINPYIVKKWYIEGLINVRALNKSETFLKTWKFWPLSSSTPSESRIYRR